MSDDGAARLFAYGTLLHPAVRAAVCGRTLHGRPAMLADFARYALTGEVYPAVVEAPGAETPGEVFEGLDAALWRVLDDWESPLYQRRTVAVRVAGSAPLTAQVYVLAPAHHGLLASSPWCPREFARLHADAYLARFGTAW
ncbi:MAG: gamma-glutamylcyclotransferase [Gammaproteobacteria bacterium]|nr:gamma-glutamylcyclotransferase [Gammaproteobacteria bacterium]